MVLYIVVLAGKEGEAPPLTQVEEVMVPPSSLSFGIASSSLPLVVLGIQGMTCDFIIYRLLPRYLRTYPSIPSRYSQLCASLRTWH